MKTDQLADTAKGAINENAAVVDQSTPALGRIAQSLLSIVAAVDDLATRKGLLGVVIIGVAILLLIPWLMLAVLVWRLARAVAVLRVCANGLRGDRTVLENVHRLS